MFLISDKRLKLVLVTAVLLLHCGVSSASNLHISGFISQSYIRTTGNNYLMESRNGSFDFTEASLNLLYRPNDTFYLSSQLLHRDVGDYVGSGDNLALDYLFVGAHLLTTESFEASLMLGRTKTPWGLFHDTRDVPFSHLGILLDQSVYNEYYRKDILTSEGAKLDLSLYSSLGEFKLEWSYSFDVPGKDDNAELEDFSIQGVVDMLEGDLGLLQFARASWYSPDRNWYSALSYISGGDNDYKLYIYPLMASQAVQSSSCQWLFSLGWRQGRWNIVGEYGRGSLKYDATVTYDAPIPDLVLSSETVSEYYYLQGSWQWNENIEIFGRYGQSFGDLDDRDGSDSAIPSNGYWQDMTVGIDWYVTAEWVIKAELHHIRGTKAISDMVTPVPIYEERWNMLLLQTAYRF